MTERPETEAPARSVPACRCERADSCWHDNVSGCGLMPCGCPACRKAFGLEVAAAVAIAAVSVGVIAALVG